MTDDAKKQPRRKRVDPYDVALGAYALGFVRALTRELEQRQIPRDVIRTAYSAELMGIGVNGTPQREIDRAAVAVVTALERQPGLFDPARGRREE